MASIADLWWGWVGVKEGSDMRGSGGVRTGERESRMPSYNVRLYIVDSEIGYVAG